MEKKTDNILAFFIAVFIVVVVFISVIYLFSPKKTDENAIGIVTDERFYGSWKFNSSDNADKTAQWNNITFFSNGTYQSDYEQGSWMTYYWKDDPSHITLDIESKNGGWSIFSYSFIDNNSLVISRYDPSWGSYNLTYYKK